LTVSSSHLIAPYGGELVQLQVPTDLAAELKGHSKEWPSWDLTARQLCDLELLMSGGFSPLRGFMNRADYEGVCHNMRLANGTLWPMPITLDVSEEFARKLTPGRSKIALRDPEGVMVAVLNVEDVWQPDRTAEAQAVFNSTSSAHPGADYAINKSNPWYVGGNIQGVQPTSHYDFRTLRLTPAELRAEFKRLGWTRVVAFQTRKPMHRAHVELTLRAAKQVEANLLIHPSVEVTKPGDVDYFIRTRCYQLLLSKYPHGTVKLSMLPLATRLGGPRDGHDLEVSGGSLPINHEERKLPQQEPAGMVRTNCPALRNLRNLGQRTLKFHIELEGRVWAALKIPIKRRVILSGSFRVKLHCPSGHGAASPGCDYELRSKERFLPGPNPTR
jgi:sulfate adenylyltransferase